ncbi:MAG TPA: tetratricopeptide repeat protein [Polyangiaceae bacterium]
MRLVALLLITSCASPPAATLPTAVDLPPAPDASPSVAETSPPADAGGGTYSDDAATLFQAAQAAFDRRDYAHAEPMFRELARKFAYSRYARQAELRVADILFAQGKFEDARRAYTEWARAHRSETADVESALGRAADAAKRLDAGP